MNFKLPVAYPMQIRRQVKPIRSVFEHLYTEFVSSNSYVNQTLKNAEFIIILL